MEDIENTIPSLRTSQLSNWFASALAISRQELRQLVYTPLTVIFQSWFLLAINILVFLAADFFSTDLARFDLLWTFLPWVSIVLVPALAMRAFAENTGDRSFELIMSFPVPVSAIVIGKWLAGSLILLLTLLMTAPFILTIAYLGSPDWGVALSGYIGAVLLLISFYAVSLLASSLTRDQVAAYILGLSGLTLLLFLGWDVTARTMGKNLPDGVIAALVHASPKFWFGQMTDGQIHLASIIYFSFLISICLSLTAWIIEQRRTHKVISARLIPLTTFLTCTSIAAIIFIMTIISHVPGALDMTQEKEFTLHPETVQIANQIPDEIKIEFFFSLDESAIPASIKQHAKRVRNLIDEIASRSNGQISVTINRVEPDSESEERALISGVRSIPMTSGDQFILGAVFHQNGRENTIPYFDEQRSQLLEYDLALLINSLSRENTPRIGILSPLLQPSNINTPREGFAVLEEIKRQYDVTIIPHFSDSLPDDLDVLLVIDAPILKRSMLLSIDQHVMNNRGLIVMLDPYPRFNSANAQTSPLPSDDINDITDILAAYGIVYQGSNVVGDRDLGTPVVGADGNQISYPFWLRIEGSSLSLAHGVTSSLNELLYAESGSFKIPQGVAGFDKLIITGKKSGILPRDQFKIKSPELLAALFKPDENDGRSIAVALRGEAQSAFTKSPSDAELVPLISKTEAANIFAVADADWLFDPMSLQNVGNNGRELIRPLNDNITFLLNMIEFASGDPKLLGIRSRKKIQRSFTIVSKMLRSGRQRYEAHEADYVTHISKVEENIAQVLSVTGATNIDQLPDNLQIQIRELRKNILSSRRDLRQIRQNMREDVERLEFRIILLNILGGPAFAIVLIGLIWSRRQKKTVTTQVPNWPLFRQK